MNTPTRPYSSLFWITGQIVVRPGDETRLSPKVGLLERRSITNSIGQKPSAELAIPSNSKVGWRNSNRDRHERASEAS